MKGDNASWVEDIEFSSPKPCSLYTLPFCCFNVPLLSPLYLFCFHFWSICFFISMSLSAPFSPIISTFPFKDPAFSWCALFNPLVLTDPGAIVDSQSAVPYKAIAVVLALLVFTVICVLVVTIWCSVRQKGKVQTHSKNAQLCLSQWEYFIIFASEIVSHFYRFQSNLQLKKTHWRGQLRSDSL